MRGLASGVLQIVLIGRIGRLKQRGSSGTITRGELTLSEQEKMDISIAMIVVAVAFLFGFGVGWWAGDSHREDRQINYDQGVRYK